jgi:hypothetical protein
VEAWSDEFNSVSQCVRQAYHVTTAGAVSLEVSGCTVDRTGTYDETAAAVTATFLSTCWSKTVLESWNGQEPSLLNRRRVRGCTQ